MQQQDGNGAGIDDVHQEEGYDDLVVVPEGPGIFPSDKMHEPDVALPDEEGDEGKEGVAGQELEIIIQSIRDKPRDVGNKKAQYRDTDQFDHPVVESIFIVHSSWVRAMAPYCFKICFKGIIPENGFFAFRRVWSGSAMCSRWIT